MVNGGETMTPSRPIAIVRSRPAEPRHGEVLCHVCGKPVDGPADGACRDCSRPVHIAWAENRSEPDCSHIAPATNSCGVSFLCNPCYAKLGSG